MSIHSKIPLMILAVFFLASANFPEADTEKFGDAIIVASISDARTLVPILASDSASSDVCGMLYNGLVKYDRNVEIVGDLAESWEILDGGLVILFHLKAGIKWHDGHPFTARDVEFTYRKLIDPDVRTPYSGDYERVKSLEVLDDHTVKITYSQPFSPGLSSWGMPMMPKHLLENDDLNKTGFSRSPVGTGPYKFKSWRTGEKIELVSNHEYFEGRPYIDRYIYRIIPDDATIFLELQTQGVDLALLTPLQFMRQTESLLFKTRYQKFEYPGFGYTYMGYNLSDPKFKDVRVRRAIDYAVNKKDMIETVLFGLAEIITGPFIIDSWAYNNAIKPASYDPEKAKGLLRQAGWSDTDGDGWADKDGRPFEFTVLVNHGNNDRLKMAEMMQKYLSDVGIKMKIRALEWSAMINDFINKKRFEAVLMGWSLSRDPDNYDIWHSSKIREGEFNFIGYKNERVDRMLEEGRRTFDLKKRSEIYHEIHTLIYEDQPYLFLYSAKILPIVNKRFRGVEVSPIGIGYNFIKWYVPVDERRYK